MAVSLSASPCEGCWCCNRGLLEGKYSGRVLADERLACSSVPEPSLAWLALACGTPSIGPRPPRPGYCLAQQDAGPRRSRQMPTWALTTGTMTRRKSCGRAAAPVACQTIRAWVRNSARAAETPVSPASSATSIRERQRDASDDRDYVPFPEVWSFGFCTDCRLADQGSSKGVRWSTGQPRGQVCPLRALPESTAATCRPSPDGPGRRGSSGNPPN